MTSQNEKKRNIINAFINLVRTHGFNRVNLSDVADRCGLSKSALYYYFDSKEALLTETLEFVFSKINDLFTEEISGITDPEERLQRFIEIKIRLFTDESYTKKILSFSEISHRIIEEVEKYIFSSPAIVEKTIHMKETELKYLYDTISEIRTDLSDEMVDTLSLIIQRSLEGFFEVLTLEKKLETYNIETFKRLQKRRENIAEPHVIISQLVLNGIKYFNGG